MLVVPTLKPEGELLLDAYSDDREDFKKISEELKAADVKPEAHDMDNPGKRENKRFVVTGPDIPKLEKYMQANFQKDGLRHIVEFDNVGDVYNCKQMDEQGKEGESLRIMAKNERLAALKAGLIANNNRWYDAQIVLEKERR